MIQLKSLLTENIDKSIVKKWYSEITNYRHFDRNIYKLYRPKDYKWQVEWKQDGTQVEYEGATMLYKPDKSDDFEVRVPHGYGVRTSKNVTVTGQFENGYPNGWVEYKFGPKESYTGNVKNSAMNGYGVYKFPDGSVYSGNFVDDSMSGFGKITWKNGESYEGYFESGLYNGYGVHTYDGKTDKGLFKDGEFISKSKEVREKGASAPDKETESPKGKSQPTGAWYKYTGDDVYVYQQRDGNWYAKNINTSKEFNIQQSKYQKTLDLLDDAKAKNTLTKV